MPAVTSVIPAHIKYLLEIGREWRLVTFFEPVGRRGKCQVSSPIREVVIIEVYRQRQRGQELEE